MQKSLQGLDNITAEGTEAIENMRTVVKILADSGANEKLARSIQQRINEAKKYLKVDFKIHVRKDATHR